VYFVFVVVARIVFLLRCRCPWIRGISSVLPPRTTPVELARTDTTFHDNSLRAVRSRASPLAGGYCVTKSLPAIVCSYRVNDTDTLTRDSNSWDADSLSTLGTQKHVLQLRTANRSGVWSAAETFPRANLSHSWIFRRHSRTEFKDCSIATIRKKSWPPEPR
jgi:hypothetical protein